MMYLSLGWEPKAALNSEPNFQVTIVASKITLSISVYEHLDATVLTCRFSLKFFFISATRIYESSCS